MARRTIIKPADGVYLPTAPQKPTLPQGLALMMAPKPKPAPVIDAQTTVPTVEKPAMPEARKEVPAKKLRHDVRVLVSPETAAALEAAVASKQDQWVIVRVAARRAIARWLVDVREGNVLPPQPFVKSIRMGIIQKFFSEGEYELLRSVYGVQGVGLIANRVNSALQPYIDAAVIEILVTPAD